MQLPSQTQLYGARVLQLTWIRRALLTATLQVLSSQEELLGTLRQTFMFGQCTGTCQAAELTGPSFLSEVAVLQPQLAG